MKKFRFLSLHLFLLISGFTYAQTSTPPAAGDGSAGNPYQIATLNNLYWLTQNSAEWSKHYIQTANIDASSSSGWNGGQGFNPIGSATTQFTGTYNGQNNLVTVLYINRPAGNDQGLFGVVRAATFSNLKFSNVNIIGNDNVGALYGRGITTASNVSNCSVSGYVDGHANVGGLVGKAQNPSGTISDCTSTASMFGWRFIGGIAGLIEGSAGHISNCFYSGSMDYEHIEFGGAVLGGIVGQTAAEITRCCAEVNISGVEAVGGIAGGGSRNISECSSSGTISGSFALAGIVGGNFGADNTSNILKNCHSSINITIVGTGFEVGGIVGFLRDIVENCYYSGAITGTTSRHKGGVAGRNYNGIVRFNLFDITNNPGFIPVGTGAGGDTGSNSNNFGKTTTEMEQQVTFQSGGLNWNFTTVWNIDEGNDYPFLINSACQTCSDTDGDGHNDASCGGDDNCPNDPNKTAPGICGCGVADTDTDDDGTADCNDGCPNDPNKIAEGICGCGVADTDSDGDGTANCNDGCPNDPNKIAPGICGCGVADVDADGDGTADCNDGCPNDPNKIAEGICGCGVADVDADGDGFYACLNDCDDNNPNINPSTSPEQTSVIHHNPNSVTVYWSNIPGSTNYGIRYRVMGSNGPWIEASSLRAWRRLYSLAPCTDYEVQFRNYKNGSWNCWSVNDYFLTTGCAKPFHPTGKNGDPDWQTFPNPTANILNILLNENMLGTPAQLTLRDQLGRAIWHSSIQNLESTLIQLNMRELEIATGVYTLTLQSEAGVMVRQVVVSQ